MRWKKGFGDLKKVRGAIIDQDKVAELAMDMLQKRVWHDNCGTIADTNNFPCYYHNINPNCLRSHLRKIPRVVKLLRRVLMRVDRAGILKIIPEVYRGWQQQPGGSVKLGDLMANGDNRVP
jgi:hypothetical protein